MTALEMHQVNIRQFKKSEFKTYLKKSWDYIDKFPAVKIGCHDFDLTIRESVDVYNEVFDV